MCRDSRHRVAWITVEKHNFVAGNCLPDIGVGTIGACVPVMIYHHLIANSKIVEGKGCLHRVVRIVQVNFKDIKVERIIGEPISR